MHVDSGSDISDLSGQFEIHSYRRERAMASFENITVPQANVTSQSVFQLDIVKIFTLSFHFLFGPPIHGYIIWLILMGERTVSDFLHLSLSVCEVIISITSLLYLLELMFQQISPWSKFAVGLIITGRPLFECLICVERYLAVVHPVTFLKYKPLRYKLMCSAVAWVITLGSCVFTLFTVVAQYKVYMFGLLFQFFFYFFVNLYCCLVVLRALKQSGPGERGRKKEEENNMKRRAFQRILITTVTVVIVFIPTIIAGCLSVLSNQDVSNFASVSFSCLILAGFLQPVLFLYQNGKQAFICSNCSWKIQK